MTAWEIEHGGLVLPGKAGDLKSTGAQAPWGFESRALRHRSRYSCEIYPACFLSRVAHCARTDLQRGLCGGRREPRRRITQVGIVHDRVAAVDRFCVGSEPAAYSYIIFISYIIYIVLSCLHLRRDPCRAGGVFPTVLVAFIGAVSVIIAQRKLWHTARLGM